jgi:hypothetical protein
MNDEGLLDKKVFHKFAVSGYPACGTPSEALNFHGLDGASLAKQILDRYRLKKSAARFER